MTGPRGARSPREVDDIDEHWAEFLRFQVRFKHLLLRRLGQLHPGDLYRLHGCAFDEMAMKTNAVFEEEAC